MNRPTAAHALAFLFFLISQAVQAQQKPEWTWKDKSGQEHTEAELKDILRLNDEYEESNGKSGVRASLAGARLVDAHLSGAYLVGVNLSGGNLYDANLEKATVSGADLRGADMDSARLRGALLLSANLSGADLSNAHLENAILNSADLSGADMDSANLSGAFLVNSANLSGANLSDADLERVRFEPKFLPELRGIAAAKNLELLTYDDNPDALAQLRKQFQDGGFRIQERKITYALKRKEAELSWDGCASRKTGDTTRAILWSSDSNLANCGSFILNKVFFDWTCQYGMSPGRPLSLGVLLWLLCSVLYFACIRIPGEAGLYRVYAQSIEEDPSAHRHVERISPPVIAQTRGVRRLLQFSWRELAVLRAGMFFSLMSAFNIGFRDINFGRWLRLLTRQEFDIKALGWARVVAGWQSLVSVYLIALWVLTYFGRPFG